MAKISVGELRPGMRLAYDLRDAGGRLLLAARRPLTPEALDALNKRAVRTLEIRSEADLPSEMRTEDGPRRAWLMADSGNLWSLESAEMGSPADAGVPPAPELVGAGRKGDEGEDHAEAERRGTEHERAMSRVRAALRRSADEVIAFRTPRWNRLGLRVAPSATARLERAPSEGFGGGAGEQDRIERVGLVRRMLTRLAEGEHVGTGASIALVDELIDEAARRPGALVRAALEGKGGVGGADDPAGHAYAVAAVGVAGAAMLGWSWEDCRAAGLAGMLADSGVALLPWDIRSEPRSLTEVETNAMRRHPAYSAALLELVRGSSDAEAMPESVQLAVYQHHEREDGSGYPNRLRGEQIHDVARVVGVADVLVGLVSARAHRPAMDVPSALEEVARQANAGTLHRAAARTLAEMLADEHGIRVVTRGAEGLVAA
jgi:hypothetical protein